MSTQFGWSIDFSIMAWGVTFAKILTQLPTLKYIIFDGKLNNVEWFVQYFA